MMRLYYVGILLVLLVGGFTAAAQETIAVQGKDSVSFFYIRQADRLRYQKLDSTELNIAAGNVFMEQDKTRFWCDSAVINKSKKIVEAYGKVHINDKDSVNIYSDYLIYHLDTRISEVRKGVTLTDGKSTLTSDYLQYDGKARTGVYTTGGKIVNGKTVITSKAATYYADMKDVYFRGDVKLRDPSYNLDTDSLLYNTDSQISTFITKTTITDSTGGNIVTSEGNYDMKQKRATFGRRSVIRDGKGVTVTGDNIFTDDSTGSTIITGNGVYIDTVQKVSILANYMTANKKTGKFLATQHPLMILEQDHDSTYIASDTMYSARMTDLHDSLYQDLSKDTITTKVVINARDSAELRYFQCFHHVRIFSDSLQAVCDSLFYSGRDSVFRLFKNPIAWANNSQVTGDTMYLYTKDKKADRMYVFYDGIAINLTDTGQYNQISGRTLNAFFKDGSIDNMRAKGSAQSIYYAKDEHNGLIGVNNISGDIIDMKYDNKKLQTVICRGDPSGGMYPLSQLPDDKKQLRNFNWMDNKRPKTKYELFENAGSQD